MDAASASEIEERMRAAFAAQLERFEEPLPGGNAASASDYSGGGRTPRGSPG